MRQPGAAVAEKPSEIEPDDLSESVIGVRSPPLDACLDQAAAKPALFRFRRPATKPITPRPPANSGNAAGNGVADGDEGSESERSG